MDLASADVAPPPHRAELHAPTSTPSRQYTHCPASPGEGMLRHDMVTDDVGGVFHEMAPQRVRDRRAPMAASFNGTEEAVVFDEGCRVSPEREINCLHPTPATGCHGPSLCIIRAKVNHQDKVWRQGKPLVLAIPRTPISCEDMDHAISCRGVGMPRVRLLEVRQPGTRACCQNRAYQNRLAPEQTGFAVPACRVATQRLTPTLIRPSSIGTGSDPPRKAMGGSPSYIKSLA